MTVYTVAASVDDGSVNELDDSFSTATCAFGRNFVDPDQNIYSAYYRFSTAAIPQGVTITSAFLTFNANGNQTGVTVKVLFYADKSASPTAPTTYATYYSKTRTTTSVAWSPAAWSNHVTYDSPDISEVIQEVVNSYTTTAIQIFVQDNVSSTSAVRVPHDYGVDTGRVTTLTITYTEAGVGAVIHRRLLMGLGKIVNFWNLNKWILKFPKLKWFKHVGIK